MEARKRNEIRKFNRAPEDSDTRQLAKVTDNLTGIEVVFVEALYQCAVSWRGGGQRGWDKVVR